MLHLSADQNFARGRIINELPGQAGRPRIEKGNGRQRPPADGRAKTGPNDQADIEQDDPRDDENE
ncbi:MAG: hypothetical protein AAF269_08760 [Pseudomonadota bacterium]